MLAVTALSTALALTACSDDGGDDTTAETPSGGQSSPTASESPGVPATGCRADVQIKGAASAAWKGQAYSSESDGVTVYRTSKGKGALALNAEGDKATALLVTIGGKNYVAKPKDVDLERTDDGMDVSAKLPVDGGSATVTASFLCADA